MSIPQFIEYIALERKYSIHTQNAYKKDLLDFQVFCYNTYKETNIDTIPYSIIRSWIVSLVESGNVNRTINRKISVLRSYYNFLIKLEIIESSPLKRHVPLKEIKKIQIPFSEKEMELLFSGNHFENDYQGVLKRTLIELLYSTGIRRSELVELQLKDVSFDLKTIRVLGKQNKERIIPVIEPSYNSLKEYLSIAKSTSNYILNSYFFQTRKGKKISVDFVYKTVNDYIRLVSTKVKRSPHMLRHSFATHLLNQGANLNAVKELLGHASLAATQIYTHTSMDKIKKVYEKAHPRGMKK